MDVGGDEGNVMKTSWDHLTNTIPTWAATEIIAQMMIAVTADDISWGDANEYYESTMALYCNTAGDYQQMYIHTYTGERQSTEKHNNFAYRRKVGKRNACKESGCANQPAKASWQLATLQLEQSTEKAYVLGGRAPLKGGVTLKVPPYDRKKSKEI